MKMDKGTIYQSLILLSCISHSKLISLFQIWNITSPLTSLFMISWNIYSSLDFLSLNFSKKSIPTWPKSIQMVWLILSRKFCLLIIFILFCFTSYSQQPKPSCRFSHLRIKFKYRIKCRKRRTFHKIPLSKSLMLCDYLLEFAWPGS